ncbi:beta-glucosidase D [Penicillium macrosclerotiorum]|uniref:beta-glucosidase D n=1 Tax=Penicillium macrosclerotiorum TaxID=303699 RepID=UPI00254944A1|nr:beta-glucosidase D [Penicillium macrosclerotiorum]KAJ5682768.1 beta-glucosidase D [Penicillium macrosclerotiorum]
MKTLQLIKVLSALAWAVEGVVSDTANSHSSTAPYLANGYLNLGIASEAYTKAKEFVAQLNNTEKISIVKASSFKHSNISWEAYENTDGVSGLNFYYYVSAFPMGNALTQTWNRDLISAQFKAVGEEYRAIGYNLVDGALLGPLGRVPEGGRQNEAFSPDPYLSAISSAEGIRGQNSAGVVAGIRHFLLYEQETNRSSAMGGSTSAVYSSNPDDKTLHEVYMWPWADAINAGSMAVMCAMNRVNATHSCENKELLMDKLKTQLGFPGFVYPDESAQFSSYGSANAGLDYSPYAENLWTESTLSAGLANGSLTVDRLDDMAVRSVLPYYFVHLDKETLPTVSTDYTAYRDVRGNHSSLIRKVGGEAISLLKNNNKNGRGLPLNKPRSISLYGAHAGPSMAGPNHEWSVSGTDSDIYQGHLATGGGSGQTSLPYLITPFNSLTNRAVQDNSMIWWILNNTYTDDSGSGGFSIAGGTGTGTAPSFANYADASNVCLCFINSWSGEGADRNSLSNEAQDTMVKSVASNCNNTIVIVNVSGPRVLDAWIEHENVTAVLYSGLLGQESGNAIADVLYGDVNPSGKLIHTIAKNESNYPTSVCMTANCLFKEGVNIDYRWFDEKNIEPRYPFGHGLSYTHFKYGEVSAQITNHSAIASKYPTGRLGLGGQEDLFNEIVKVTTSVRNVGSLKGAEVAQLYVSFPKEAKQPVRILRGFEKSTIAADETAQIQFSLRRRDLSYWDVAAQKWAIARGQYTFSVGSSSRDLRGNSTLTL